MKQQFIEYLRQIISFHYGELITTILKTSLYDNKDNIILYSTLFGSICALIPFKTKTNVNFFETLEMNLSLISRNENILGREHISFRSYYFPIKGVIDGDLCEEFYKKNLNIQKKITKLLREDSVDKVKQKLQKMREAVL